MLYLKIEEITTLTNKLNQQQQQNATSPALGLQQLLTLAANINQSGLTSNP